MWVTELSNYLTNNSNHNEINTFKVSAAIADKTVFFCKFTINCFKVFMRFSIQQTLMSEPKALILVGSQTFLWKK